MIKQEHWLFLAAVTMALLVVPSNGVQGQDGDTRVKDSNFLIREWDGPYGGVPPWKSIQTDDFVAAFDRAIELSSADIDRIANNPDPPTFDNTFVALEKAGQTLTRASNMFGVYSSNLNLGSIPDIEAEVMPKLSKHNDSIMQNNKLFKRVAAVYEGDQMKQLDPAQQRLVDDRYKSFVRQGAKLDADAKARLSQINAQLAGLFTQFSQNVLNDEQLVTIINDKRQLQGLPESVVDAMSAAAKQHAVDKKLSGDDAPQWVINNTRSSMEPVLTYADDRPLREQVWKTYYSRGDNADENDNNQIITAILKLRAERAKLLGYETHAHWRLEPQMAKNPENAMQLMMQVWPKAVARVQEEVTDMQAVADQSGAKISIEPWDYRFYAEKVRKDKYDLDFNQVKPYLQLEKLREGMMWAAEQIYGFQFKPVTNVPVFHPDVRVWEVLRNGKHIGLWYFDPYARRGKRSGAWMTDYRAQENIDQPISTLVSNNSNFIKGKSGEPVLISWDDAVTLFHEFGHALHGLCSQCRYPSQSGTSVARDYVEFPSQLNEHWLSTPEILEKFAVHYETGKPMPAELLEKIEKASTFNQGFSTVEYLASALVDMKLHLAGNVMIDPDQFERKTLKELGMPGEIVMRHRTPQFSHVFANDGYSAGYYSYLWSDALTADAAEVFEKAGSYYDQKTADSLFNNIMSVGDTVDPAEGFRKFRGRDVDTKALLRKRGFPVD